MKKNKMTLKEFLPALAGAVGSALAGKAVDSLVGEEDEVTTEEVEELDEFAPIAAMAGRALGGALAGKALDKLTDGDEVEEASMSEIYESMFENFMKETEEQDGLMDKVVDFSMKTAPLAKLTGEACDEEMEEGNFPAQAQYPSSKKPTYPQHKNAFVGEGEELEETFPNRDEYPENKPRYPRVVRVRNESYMMVPVLKEAPAGAGSAIVKQLWPQLLQIVAALPPELLAKVPDIVASMLQGKRAIGAGSIGESKRPLVEGFSSWLAQQGVDPNAFARMGGRQKDDLVRQFIDHKKALSQATPPTSPEQAQSELDTMTRDNLPTNQPQPQRPDLSVPKGRELSLRRAGLPTMKQPSSLAGQELSLQRTGLPTNKPQESKKVTKESIKRTIKEAILIREKKSFLERVVRGQINEQLKTRAFCEKYLNEDNIWSGVNNAGQTFDGSGAPQGATGQPQVSDQAKEAQKAVGKAIGDVNKAKSKFTQDSLKSANLVSQYHSAVTNLKNVFDQVQGMLSGPESKQLTDQVNQAISQLQQDLNSEKESIDTFLSSLDGGSTTPPPQAVQTEFPTAKELNQEGREKSTPLDKKSKKKSK